MKPRQLTPKQERFAQGVLRAKNWGDAYREVYGCKPGKENTMSGMAAYVAAKPHVAARIQELRNESAKIAVFEAADVLREWIAIATANPNELISHRRLNCRHCYGHGNAYQWRDDSEYAVALGEAMDDNLDRMRAKKPPNLLPGRDGGMGYDHTRPPAPDCPHCRGEGVGDVHLADTRNLKGSAAKLYAGVKQTKFGVEVIMRDQDAALMNIAKFLGMMNDKPTKDTGTPEGDPVQFLKQLAGMLPN